MADLVTLLSQFKKKQQKYFSNPFFWAEKIKKIVSRSLQPVEVYLFGSLVDKQTTPSSDIDVLVVFSHLPSSSVQVKLKGEIYRTVGLASPFEIHFVDKKGFAWYKRFIKKKLKKID